MSNALETIDKELEKGNQIVTTQIFYTSNIWENIRLFLTMQISKQIKTLHFLWQIMSLQ